jgi:hypothetical protein
MVIDDKKNLLYATDLYNSLVFCIDIEKNVLINSINVSVPTFISLLNHAIIVLTSNDMVYVINIQTFKLRFKFEINRSTSLSSLYTIKEHNAVFLTCHEVLADDVKSKNTYMCVIKIEAYKGMYTRKIFMDIEHVNDMVFTFNSIVCVNDTHVAVFNYHDIEGLLKWTVS